MPWLVWLSGLSAGLRTKGLPVQFPVRTLVWVVGQVPSWGRTRGNHTLMFLSLSLPSPSLKIKIKSFKKRYTFIISSVIFMVQDRAFTLDCWLLSFFN